MARPEGLGDGGNGNAKIIKKPWHQLAPHEGSQVEAEISPIRGMAASQSPRQKPWKKDDQGQARNRAAGR